MNPAIFEILPKNQAPSNTFENTPELKAALELQIAHMLVNETEKLWQVLYRLDVSENKKSKVLENFKQSDWPKKLTELILEREDQRQYWRKQYGENQQEKPLD